MHWRRKWQPNSVFLPGESQGRGSLVSGSLWGRTELDMTEATYQQQQCMNKTLFSEADGGLVGWFCQPLFKMVQSCIWKHIIPPVPL